MYDYVIIPDTACDLQKELRERFGITDYLHGFLYYPDGRCERTTLDWETITPKEYYDSMRGKKILYRTATPAIGEVEEIFEKYLREGKDVLSISLSGGLSSSYANTVTVAEQLREKYPERKIVCIDSKHYSTALALLVIEACKKREEGLTIEENEAYLNEERFAIHQMGSMDDLFFLVKTGRVTNFKAFFGQMIGLNLLADFNRTGMAEVIGKVKGKRDVIAATLEYMEQTGENIQDQLVFVAHTNRDAFAELLADEIRKKFNPKEIIINPVGQSCGATIGPGMCCAFYRGKPVSEDMAKERIIMDNILSKDK